LQKLAEIETALSIQWSFHSGWDCGTGTASCLCV